MTNRTRSCDELCGCEVPCPGGAGCRCATVGVGATRTGVERHSTCSCGEHCSCNPCTCGRSTELTVTGRGTCGCGPGCTCPSCPARI